MNQRVTPPSSAKGRRAWLYFSLLLPSLASEVAQSPSPPAFSEGPFQGRTRSGASRPYLRALGPPALRFQDSLPPPDFYQRPPAAAQPKPEQAALNPNGPDVILHKAQSIAASVAPVPARQEETPSTQAAPPSPPIAAIPPDDAQPKARPEDFLPYFQFPGAEIRSSDTNAAGGTQAADSAPKSIPPSSASYQEQ